MYIYISPVCVCTNMYTVSVCVCHIHGYTQLCCVLFSFAGFDAGDAWAAS